MNIDDVIFIEETQMRSDISTIIWILQRTLKIALDNNILGVPSVVYLTVWGHYGPQRFNFKKSDLVISTNFKKYDSAWNVLKNSTYFSVFPDILVSGFEGQHGGAGTSSFSHRRLVLLHLEDWCVVVAVQDIDLWKTRNW